MYIFQCGKCDDMVIDSFITANNKPQALDHAQDAIKRHDLTEHDDDGEFMRGDMVRLVPELRRLRRKRSGRDKVVMGGQ
jgi:hypothetical protein